MKQMMNVYALTVLVSLGLAANSVVAVPTTVEQVKQQAGQVVENVKQGAQQVVQQGQAQVAKVAEDIEHNQQAREIAAGILKPIYQLAEAMSFSAFHWLAFALMLAGVISWGLQLVIGKLVVASQGGFSLTEIISDATVLVISLVGLVLTTQAATENSAFAQSTVSVLSAAIVGLIFGIMLFKWGQDQELQASSGREKSANKGRSR